MLSPVWGGLILGLLMGIVLQRSSFCGRAALVEAFEGGGKVRLRAFVLAMATTLLGTQLLSVLNLVDLSSTLYLRAAVPLLGLVIGGALFGAGMMLADGCPSRLIVRTAQGQSEALLTWLVFVLAIMASQDGVLAPLRERLAGPSVQLPAASLMGLLTGVPGWSLVVSLQMLMVAFLFASARDSGWQDLKKSLSGALVGLHVAASWYVSTAGADDFEVKTTTALAFVAPAQDLLRFLAMERLGFPLKFGSASVLGVFIGAFVSAVAGRRFVWPTAPKSQILRNLVGGVLMAVGGIQAMGCTIGQGLAGVATLSLSSLIAVVSMVLGAWSANRLLRHTVPIA